MKVSFSYISGMRADAPFKCSVGVFRGDCVHREARKGQNPDFLALPSIAPGVKFSGKHRSLLVLGRSWNRMQPMAMAVQIDKSARTCPTSLVAAHCSHNVPLSAKLGEGATVFI